MQVDSFYPIFLTDRNTDDELKYCLLWSSEPQTWFQGERSCIFRPHYLKKESYQLVDARI